MGTLWWPCSKGKSPSRELSLNTVARTLKWSASTALTASRRSSFYRYQQRVAHLFTLHFNFYFTCSEYYSVLCLLSLLQSCRTLSQCERSTVRSTDMIFPTGLVRGEPLQPRRPLLLQHTHRGTQGAVCVGSFRLLARVQQHLSGYDLSLALKSPHVNKNSNTVNPIKLCYYTRHR